jgi:hypothetical protein
MLRSIAVLCAAISMFLECRRAACVRRGETDEGTFAWPWNYLGAGT